MTNKVVTNKSDVTNKVVTNKVVTNKVVTNKVVTNKVVTNVSLKCFYTNADQFVNKRDDLLMMISDDRPDLILITEMIPKKQINPITDQLLDFVGYKAYYNFDPNISNLGTLGIRGVAI